MKKYLVNLYGLNLANIVSRLGKDNVKISNLIQKSNEEMEFVASGKDIKELKKYFKNVKYSFVDLRKKNLKAKIFKTLAVYLALPVILFFATIYSKQICKIEINGLNQIKKSEIIELLEGGGVKVGGAKTNSTQEIEKLLLKNDRIAQVSCYFKGTTLIINISEKLILSQDVYEPIVACYDGVIYDYNLKRGTLNFKIGDFVKAGDILVYPFVYDKENNKVAINPEAEIFARIYKSYTSKLLRFETYYEKTGNKKSISYIKFKNLNKNTSFKPFVFYEETVYNKYISSVLPIVKQTIIHEELIERRRENDLVSMQSKNEEASRVLAREDNAENQTLLEKTYSVLANDVLFSTTTIVYEGDITKG